MNYTDQIGEIIVLDKKPERIISLVPSQTELLHYLGLDDRVIGITKFCIYPKDWHKTKERVGGTKSIDLEKVKSLAPDLIIGNKEENTKEDIEALKKIAPVWMSDVNSIEEALEMIDSIGQITETVDRSSYLINEIQSAFASLQLSGHQKVIYYIWNDPDYAVGKKTFIHSMIKACGWENAVLGERYPEVSENIPVDLVLLSSEPYPFKQEHKQKYQRKHHGSKVVFVDGEMFSWYGSRMRLAPDYFKKLAKSI